MSVSKALCCVCVDSALSLLWLGWRCHVTCRGGEKWAHTTIERPWTWSVQTWAHRLPFIASSKGDTKWTRMKWLSPLINHRNGKEADLCCSAIANSELHWLLTRLLLSRRQHRTSIMQWQPPVIPQHTKQCLSVGIAPKAQGNLAAALKWTEQDKAKHLLVGWE